MDLYQYDFFKRLIKLTQTFFDFFKSISKRLRLKRCLRLQNPENYKLENYKIFSLYYRTIFDFE